MAAGVGACGERCRGSHGNRGRLVAEIREYGPHGNPPRERLRGPAIVSKVNRAALEQLIRKQRYRCALTNRKLTPQTVSLDHVVPLSRTGRDGHRLDNVQLVTSEANRAKGAMDAEDFLQLCRDVVRTADAKKRRRRKAHQRRRRSRADRYRARWRDAT